MASTEAALALLTETEAEEHDDDKAIAGIRAQLSTRLNRYLTRLDLLDTAGAGGIPLAPEYEVGLRRSVIEAQRHELLRWDVGRLPDESLRKLERELDHAEGLSPSRTLR